MDGLSVVSIMNRIITKEWHELKKAIYGSTKY